ncbi:hydrogenase maturation protease [Desulfocicer vacuolatum DSM 3385]|uniref:Hydrogenase maturation protease n=1 Tax=Desulfocicer vacuolatum DSM 3385 TaxID=1121400 RepID=A0A1W2A6K1_9BACT|nr:hydrogenase maturation protease [Desulfocicer vacuolatum]SMC56266.1 hydrogenase maturation protease [Desulfocicer vacuolatum DSM 3385]
MQDRIICLGNRLKQEDRAGLQVYDRLFKRKLPQQIELIEGGISGLNLLCFLENVATVVFVDAISGFTHPDGVVVLTRHQIETASQCLHYGHDAGVAYLLAMMPRVCTPPLPRDIFLVGLEGQCSEKTIEHAADIAQDMVQTGKYGALPKHLHYQTGKIY